MDAKDEVITTFSIANAVRHTFRLGRREPVMVFPYHGRWNAMWRTPMDGWKFWKSRPTALLAGESKQDLFNRILAGIEPTSYSWE